MKKYLLFSGDNYYPAGGVCDFKGSYDTVEEAKAAKLKNNDWAHIVTIDGDKFEDVACYPAFEPEWDYSVFRWKEGQGCA